MSKQTALEWLGYELNTSLFSDISPELWEKVIKIFEQAKQMEKEQIIGAYNRDVIDGIQDWFIGNGTHYYELHYEGKSGNKKHNNPEKTSRETKTDENYSFEDGV